jgi:hypothetical protein
MQHGRFSNDPFPELLLQHPRNGDRLFAGGRSLQLGLQKSPCCSSFRRRVIFSELLPFAAILFGAVRIQAFRIGIMIITKAVALPEYEAYKNG